MVAEEQGRGFTGGAEGAAQGAHLREPVLLACLAPLAPRACSCSTKTAWQSSAQSQHRKSCCSTAAVPARAPSTLHLPATQADGPIVPPATRASSEQPRMKRRGGVGEEEEELKHTWR